MSMALRKLEVFETAPLEDAEAQFDAHQAARLRETAYEEGYAAGWQDALENMRNDDALRRIAAEEALQQIEFGYAEAHQALSQAFLRLTEAILAKVLPQAVAMALPERVLVELQALAEGHTQTPVEIACAPAVLAVLEPLTRARSDLPLSFVAEPSFSAAQVALRMGVQERAVDFDALLDALRTVLAQHSPNPETQEKAHG
ncbi:MAG: hypothetical protein JJU09_05520 [Rhodobacteraceae bacterium]|nr:hypothetical protein [Paracoccaceae bacterium]